MIVWWIIGVLLMFLIIGMVLYRVSRCCRGISVTFDYMSEDEDDKMTFVHKYKRIMMYLVPLCILIAGFILIYIALDKYNHNTFTTNESLMSLKPDIQSALNIVQGLKDVKLEGISHGLSSFISYINQYTSHQTDAMIVRNFFLIFIGVIALLASVIGYYLVSSKKSSLLSVLVIVMSVTVMITFFMFTFHTMESDYHKDICREVDYKNGTFDLFYYTIIDGIKKNQTTFENYVVDKVLNACTILKQFCSLPLQVCSVYDCNVDNVLNITSYPAIDSSTQLTIKSCSTSCVNDNSLSSAVRVVNAVNDVTPTINLYRILQKTSSGLPLSLRNDLRDSYCVDTSSPSILMYIGLALFLFGELIVVFFLIYNYQN
eukprot:TRINITY_DN1898_c0_g1_i1.p1 TRINITY_DN1898_c0_g1~~TRINITY_DN1898_c0_g1_i1.p1  ORF type:complete len:373 (+),score=84.82 TRINITY_DN1898_c0_g1_i1:409-1527(+)